MKLWYTEEINPMEYTSIRDKVRKVQIQKPDDWKVEEMGGMILPFHSCFSKTHSIMKCNIQFWFVDVTKFIFLVLYLS